MPEGHTRGMLPNRLRVARRAKDLRQSEVAAALGVQQGFISKLERGEKSPSVEMLTRLASLYGVTESYLLGKSTKEESAEYAAPGNLIATDTDTPRGLRELASDAALVETLKITPSEWLALGSIALPSPTDKAGYVQLLATIRGIARG